VAWDAELLDEPLLLPIADECKAAPGVAFLRLRKRRYDWLIRCMRQPQNQGRPNAGSAQLQAVASSSGKVEASQTSSETRRAE
jgi:hypothetical protein